MTNPHCPRTACCRDRLAARLPHAAQRRFAWSVSLRSRGCPVSEPSMCRETRAPADRSPESAYSRRLAGRPPGAPGTEEVPSLRFRSDAATHLWSPGAHAPNTVRSTAEPRAGCDSPGTFPAAGLPELCQAASLPTLSMLPIPGIPLSAGFIQTSS